jgi:hypothetical protein
MNQLTPVITCPALIAAGGQRASYRPFESLVSTTFEGQLVEAIFRGL